MSQPPGRIRGAALETAARPLAAANTAAAGAAAAAAATPRLRTAEELVSRPVRLLCGWRPCTGVHTEPCCLHPPGAAGGARQAEARGAGAGAGGAAGPAARGQAGGGAQVSKGAMIAWALCSAYTREARLAPHPLKPPAPCPPPLRRPGDPPARSGWNPSAAAAAQSPRAGRSQGSHSTRQAPQAAGSGPASSAASDGSVAAGLEGRRSISSADAAPAPVAVPPAVAQPSAQPPAPRQEASGGSAFKPAGGGWSPRKAPRSQQQQPGHPQQRGSYGGGIAPAAGAKPTRALLQPAKPGGLAVAAAAGRAPPAVPPLALGKLPLGSGSTAPRPAATAAAARSARGPAPAAAAAPAAAPPLTARPPPLPADDDASLDSAELEARRTQQLVSWGALLVQTAAVVAAERVLLGAAAQQVRGQPNLPPLQQLLQAAVLAA